MSLVSSYLKHRETDIEVSNILEHSNVLKKTQHRLLENAKKNPLLSKDVKYILRRIGEEGVMSSTAECSNIISKLVEGHYSKKTLPMFFLIEDLKQAELNVLVDEFSQMRFKDPGLNRPNNISAGLGQGQYEIDVRLRERV